MRPTFLFDTKRPWSWLLIAAVVKTVTFLYFIDHNHASARGDHFALDFGDTWSYLDPIEHLIAEGSYTPDHRMPGYGAPYFLLRMVQDPDHAKNTLVVLQLVLSVLALYSTARLASHLSGRPWAFVATFSVLCACMFVSAFDPQLATESFCASSIVLMLHTLLIGSRKSSVVWLLISGLFLAWCVFLRPICALIPLTIAFALLLRSETGLRERARSCLVVLLPFLVLESTWIVRNHQVHGGFSPLSNGTFYPQWTTSPMYAITRFVQLYGGTTIWWDTHSDIRWFNVRNPGDPLPKEGTRGAPPPSWILTCEYNMDSLRNLADLMARAHDPLTDSAKTRLLTAAIFERTDRYCSAAEREHPFRTNVNARLISLWNFLWQGGAARLYFNPWKETPLSARLVKVVQGAVYLFVVLFGMIGAAHLLLVPRRDLITICVVWILVPGVLVTPLVFRFTDYRYIVPMFPLLAICAVTLLRRALDTMQRIRG